MSKNIYLQGNAPKASFSFLRHFPLLFVLFLFTAIAACTGGKEAAKKTSTTTKTNSSDSDFNSNKQLYPILERSKSGFIDKLGQWVLEVPYLQFGTFSEGLASVVENGKTGFINQRGKVVIEPQYKDAHDFSEGMTAIQNDANLWGFIDSLGNLIIKPTYVEVGDFSEGKASVKLPNSAQWGFIDKKGSMLIFPKVNFPFPPVFSNGLA
ncbi:MAG: WG repeat-containing protein, partial [Chitinophagales bacterium]